MRAVSLLAIFIYTFLFLIIGGFLIGFSLHLILATDLVNLLNYIYNTPNLRIATGIAGILLILINISFVQLTLGKIRQEKTIAFTNPQGQVSVSLTAIEDLIRRLTSQISELKELKSDVSASKRGVQIYARVVLWSDARIPEVTEKIQETIRSHVQEMLGIEEPITTKVHVAKIIAREEKKEKTESKTEEPQIPFRGYR